MCKICQPILGFVANAHTEMDCPLAASAYCSYCGTYGHFLKDCVHKPTAPPRAIAAARPEAHPPMLRLQDDEKVIRAYMDAYGHKLQGRVKKNREFIEEYCRTNGIQLFWIKKISST